MTTQIGLLQAFNPYDKTIEECLTELEKYGLPRLRKSSAKGWMAAIDVFVTGEGAEFIVRSDHNMVPAKKAVNQCVLRLFESLDKIQQGRTK
jgi:hypothetical protein